MQFPKKQLGAAAALTAILVGGGLAAGSAANAATADNTTASSSSSSSSEEQIYSVSYRIDGSRLIVSGSSNAEWLLVRTSLGEDFVRVDDGKFEVSFPAAAKLPQISLISPFRWMDVPESEGTVSDDANVAQPGPGTVDTGFTVPGQGPFTELSAVRENYRTMVSGRTAPNTTVFVEVGGLQYILESDDEGAFSVETGSLEDTFRLRLGTSGTWYDLPVQG